MTLPVITTEVKPFTSEFVVSPPYEEQPGLRSFLRLNGIDNPAEPYFKGAATPRFNNILRRIFGESKALGDFEDLIKVIQDSTEEVSARDLLSEIKVFHAEDNVSEEELNLTILDSSIEIDKVAEGQATELLEILVEELKDEVNSVVEDDDIITKINISGNINQERALRLAQILGIDPLEVQRRSLGELLAYLSDLSKKVDDLDDFALAAGAFHPTRNFIPETALSYDVVPQIGAECVLYSTLNIANAAKANGAVMMGDISINEMQEVIPLGVGTNFRQMRYELVEYMRSKGLHASGDFSWGEAIKALQDKKGALLLRLSRNHAVAVIGIRHKKGDPGTAPQLQFLVANSLAMYDPKPEIPTRAVWADAKDLVSKTILRKADEVVSRDKLLVTWETHE